MAIRYLPAPVSYDCPDWCERPDHDADVVDASHPPLHYGPEFGFFAVQGTHAGNLAGVNGINEDVALDVGRLRRVARDATAAADWIESILGKATR